MQNTVREKRLLSDDCVAIRKIVIYDDQVIVKILNLTMVHTFKK